MKLFKIVTATGEYELYQALTEEDAIEQAFDEGFDVIDVRQFA